MLESLHQSIEKYYDQLKDHPSPKIEKAARKLGRFKRHLFREMSYFDRLTQTSALRQLSISDSLERVVSESYQLMDSLAARYQEFNLEDWGMTLSQLSQRVGRLKTEFKNIDLKGAFHHVADTLLLDHFDSLGERQSTLQWPRKAGHVLASLFILWVFLFSKGSLTTKLIIFGSFTLYATLCDILRLCWPKFNALVVRDLQKFMRKQEVNRLNSMTYFAISTFLVCLLFPNKGVVVLSVLFLGLGDTFASIVGMKWGRHKIMSGRFSIEGSLAFFLSCFLICFLYPLLVPGFTGSIWLWAVAGGLTGMLSEWASYRIDDNLGIPLISAISLQALVYLL